MSTEITSTKIVTPAGDSHSERKMILDKRSFYQNPFFIIASSLFALLVLVTVTSQNGVQYLRTDLAASMSGNEVSHDHCLQGPGASVPGLGVDGNAGSSEYCHDSGQCRVVCCDDTSPNFTKPNCCMCAEYCDEYCPKFGPHCRGCQGNMTE